MYHGDDEKPRAIATACEYGDGTWGVMIERTVTRREERSWGMGPRVMCDLLRGIPAGRTTERGWRRTGGPGAAHRDRPVADLAGPLDAAKAMADSYNAGTLSEDNMRAFAAVYRERWVREQLAADDGLDPAYVERVALASGMGPETFAEIAAG